MGILGAQFIAGSNHIAGRKTPCILLSNSSTRYLKLKVSEQSTSRVDYLLMRDGGIYWLYLRTGGQGTSLSRLILTYLDSSTISISRASIWCQLHSLYPAILEAVDNRGLYGYKRPTPYLQIYLVNSSSLRAKICQHETRPWCVRLKDEFILIVDIVIVQE